MTKFKKLFSILTATLAVSTLASCGTKSSAKNEVSDPVFSLSVIDACEDVEEENVAELLDYENDLTPESVIYSTVGYELESLGYSVSLGTVWDAENLTYMASGIYYYSDDLKFFSDESYQACGFYTVMPEGEDDLLDDKDSIFEIIDQEECNPDCSYVLTYNEVLNSDHFILNDKYYIWYQDGSSISYKEEENSKKNYDLSLGSLYDFTTGTVIYDESVADDYEYHSADSLFSEEDYDKLQADLNEQIKIQNQNGYSVDDIEIVYISSDAIEAYLNSEDSDSFFGYDVNELTEAFGLGTALTYSEDNGFQKSEILKDSSGYNWKKFMTKIAIGGAIIIVGAALTPLTGGASFTCALVTITKVALTTAVTSALSSLAISTVKKMIKGESLLDALVGSRYEALNAFSTGFLIGAATGSIGVLTGKIQCSSCFTADTLILMADLTHKCICDIKNGDIVSCFNTYSGKTSVGEVSEVFEKTTNWLTYVTLDDGDVITTTPSHPFYSYDNDFYVMASSLKSGDKIKTEGEYAVVKKVSTVYYENPVTVYNFTVDNNHNYFVSDDDLDFEDDLLVHNECTTLASKRSKAVREAWKREREIIKNGGQSQYNWSRLDKLQIKYLGRSLKYQGHHIIPVNELVGNVGDPLISDPDNIIFLLKSDHVMVHAAGDTFSSCHTKLIEICPWAEEKVTLLFQKLDVLMGVA